MFALIVTGPPGSGKTTVLTALQNALAEDGIRHAVIEVEAVSWAHPRPPDQQSFLHVAAVRRLYETAGYGLVLCGATVTSAAYLDGLMVALGADESLVVRLEAEPATLRRRIIEREPSAWSGLARLLDAADEIAVTSQHLRGVDASFSTADRTPDAIANEVRLLRPDVLGRSGEIANPA